MKRRPKRDRRRAFSGVIAKVARANREKVHSKPRYSRKGVVIKSRRDLDF